MAKVPAGTDNAQRDAMLRILDRLQARTSFSLPPNWDVALLESSRQPREVFEVAINRCDVRISKAILVPEKVGLVAGVVEGGSYSLARTQFDVAVLLRELDAQRLVATIQNQLLIRMAAYRDASRPPPQFTLKPLTQDNTQAMVQAYDSLVKDGTVQPGVRDEMHWRQLLGLPELGEAEQQQREELLAAKRAQAQVPPASPPPTAEGPPPPADAKATMTETVRVGNPAAGAADYWRSLTPIERRADMAEKAATLATESDRLGKVLAAGVQALVADVKRRVATTGLARPGAPAASIKGLTLRPAFLAALRTSVQDALQAAYDKAGRQGRGELARARTDLAEKFAQLPGLVGQRAQAFFSAKAFYITGLIEDDILKRVQQVLFNAVKGDKPERTVLLEIDQALADWLPQTDAHGNTVNVPAREEVIARTNIAEAVAEGRFAAFSDPDLPEGFVQALQHSAILDDRVRDNHRAMDGVTLPVDAWMGPPDRRPPGGFNCFAAGVRVLTADGPKPIEHIGVGELVWTHEGRLRPVMERHARIHSGRLFGIETPTGKIIWSTGDHEFLRSDGTWVPAERLNHGDELVTHDAIAHGRIGNVQHPYAGLLQKLVTLWTQAGGPETAPDLDTDTLRRQIEIEPEAALARMDDGILPFIRQSYDRETLRERLFGIGHPTSPESPPAGLQDLRDRSPSGFRPSLLPLTFDGDASVPESYSASTKDAGNGSVWLDVQPLPDIANAQSFHDVPLPKHLPGIIPGLLSERLQQYGSLANTLASQRTADTSGSMGRLSAKLSTTNDTDHLQRLVSIPTRTATLPVFSLGVHGDMSFITEGVVNANCRCTLIPVVLGDGIAMTPESEIPTDYPDPGFR